MKEWKKITSFAEGVIYARGNERKMLLPGNSAVYYKVNREKSHTRNAAKSRK
jgi:hypothetical protein